MLEKNEMIFGVRAVIDAIQAGREIDKVLVKKDIQSELDVYKRQRQDKGTEQEDGNPVDFLRNTYGKGHTDD